MQLQPVVCIYLREYLLPVQWRRQELRQEHRRSQKGVQGVRVCRGAGCIDTDESRHSEMGPLRQTESGELYELLI